MNDIKHFKVRTNLIAQMYTNNIFEVRKQIQNNVKNS